MRDTPITDEPDRDAHMLQHTLMPGLDDAAEELYSRSHGYLVLRFVSSSTKALKIEIDSVCVD